MDKMDGLMHYILTCLVMLVFYSCVMSSLKELRIEQQQTRMVLSAVRAQNDSLLTQLKGARIWLWLPEEEK